MPRYIIERDVAGATSEAIDAGTRRAVEVAAEMEGVEWVRSYVSLAEGKIYCEYEAPSADLVREHARRAGIPCDRVSEISAEIEPSMFV